MCHKIEMLIPSPSPPFQLLYFTLILGWSKLAFSETAKDLRLGRLIGSYNPSTFF
jgi:hypothetical protein